MLFLIRGKNIDSGYLVPPAQIADIVEGAVLPSFQLLAQMAQQGKIKGGTIPGERGGAFVIEVDSNEELDRIMNGLPFFGLVDWDVKALMSFDAIAQQLPEYIANIRRNMPPANG
jgi:muconolactone delta-isomerase